MVQSSISKRLQILIRVFSALLVLIVGLCIWQYPINYVFFTQTISDLGAYYTYTYTPDIQPVQNIPNPVSPYIFSGGFIIMTLMAFWMAIIYFRNGNLYVNKTKGALMVIIGIGAIGVSFPWDSTLLWLHYSHTIGSLFFAGGFGVYNFICQRLRYIRKREDIKSQSFGKKLDNFADLVCAISIFILTVWYLISGLLGALDVPRVGWLAVFSTGLAQKVLFFVTIVAGFLIDIDDI